MKLKQVYKYLCWYDERNPDYDKDSAEGRPPRTNCYCNNCFYGRDKLAVEIIRLNKK